MFAHRIGQTLIVDPAFPFAEIEAILAVLGWKQEMTESTSAPLVTDEPEIARWTRNGHKPFIIYTYNPVVSMRVLDVATLPPVFRKTIVEKIPVLDDKAIENLLFAASSRERLLGLWCARETERTDLIAAVSKLKRDPEVVVAGQAEQIALRLEHIAESRLQTMAQLQLLVQAAPTLVRRLVDWEFVRQLQPDIEDCQQLFDSDIAQRVVKLCADVYRQRPHLHAIAADAEILACAAPAGLLRWSNELSDKFPGGYRDIAGWMQPDKLWMTWKVSDPGGSTVRYDGLVWVGERWLWLPKIHRGLAPLCISGEIYAPSTLH